VSWSILSLVIDPQNSDRLILGTERLGVQVSDNGGETYRASNQGFSHRRIVDAAVDPQHPERALVVLTSNFEPLLETNDAGRTWTPLATGLKSGPPRHIFASPDGWFAAPGPGGLLRYDAAKSSWMPVNQVSEKPAASQTRAGATLKKTSTQRPSASGTKAAASVAPPAVTRSTVPFHAKVNDMAFGRDAWYAATEAGLLVSRDHGLNWISVPLAPAQQQPGTSAPGVNTAALRTVRTSSGDAYVWALAARQLDVSGDGGKTWIARSLPFEPRGPLHLYAADATTVFLASDHGIFSSHDAGNSWQQANLAESSIDDLATVRNMIVVATAKGALFISRDGARSWGRLEGPNAESTLSALRSREAGNQLVAASSTEGLFVLEMGSASLAAADPQQVSPAAKH
jgi:photosystem II stability/assembly factor-like uncharacterized protein